MAESLSWNELSRAHQRVLARLWGGGSVRGQDPEVVIGLQLMGYMQGDRLSPIGHQLCADAYVAMADRISSRQPVSVPAPA